MLSKRLENLKLLKQKKLNKLTIEINTLNIRPAFLLKTDCVLIIEYDQIIPIKKVAYFNIIQ